MPAHRASVLITDIDNTLFDWFEAWYHPFRAMLDEIVRISGIAESKLLPEIRGIHQRVGTAEYAWLIEEIPSLRAKFKGQDLTKLFDPAIHAFRSARKRHLHLYPTVEHTLHTIRANGSLIVAYTNSLAFYTKFRIQRLGLDGLLHYLYSPPDHPLPRGKTREDLRTLPPESYELAETIHRTVPAGERKPNPAVLRDIIANVGARSSDCVYVGDSLAKDIAMAKDAGVLDAHAEYGTVHTLPEYDLLREVTHWTPEDVEREKALSATEVQPTMVLESSFSALLENVEFHSFEGADSD